MLFRISIVAGLVAGIFSGSARPEKATELGKLAASMKPGTWAELKTEGYTPELLQVQSHHILEYTGAATWDPRSQQVLFVGQGHYSALRFISYDAKTNTWSKRPTPSWWKGDPESGKGPIGHAYYNNAIDPTTGTFYLHQSATKLVHRYDVAKNEWTTLPEITGASTGHGTAIAYFPERKGLLRVLGGSADFYSVEKDSWTRFPDKLAMGPYHNVAQYSAVHKVVLFGGGNNSRDLYKLDAEGKITPLKPAPFEIGINTAVVTVDPVSGDFLVLHKDDKFLSFNPVTDSWKDLGTTGMPLQMKGSSFDVVATPISSDGVTLFFTAQRKGLKVCLYKHGERAEPMPCVSVSKDRKGFVLDGTEKPFVVWGVNYDHDVTGRLIEDYWVDEWPAVEKHFAQMTKLGANVVRIHLQVGKFLDGPDRPNAKALDRLGRLLKLAEEQRLYLDLTGLGCYHKQDVPAWYDKLTEAERWDAQARFWEMIAGKCAASPAVFCYDLMNEPVVPGGKRTDGDWLGPAFGGKHFVQFITLDQKDRPRPEIARKWIAHLVKAIRKHDPRHLITVGLVDWSLDRPGLTSGFVPEKIAPDLDFLCVHLYPEKGKVDDALKTLAGFAVGKPVLIEETFPLKCSMEEFATFVAGSRKTAAGVVGFYWGKPPEELRRSKELGDAILLGWLEFFEKEAQR
jgi:hypothetical protein